MKAVKTILFLAISIFLSFFSRTQVLDSIEMCTDMKRFPYYRVEHINTRSFAEIKDYFKKSYPQEITQTLSHNTGIITIQFNINCHGEIGNFVIQSCDLDYMKNEMSPEITNYFYQKIKDLGGWIKPIEESEGPCNLHAFYSFRIVDGIIIEILPK